MIFSASPSYHPPLPATSHAGFNQPMSTRPPPTSNFHHPYPAVHPAVAAPMEDSFWRPEALQPVSQPGILKQTAPGNDIGSLRLVKIGSVHFLALQIPHSPIFCS